MPCFLAKKSYLIHLVGFRVKVSLLSTNLETLVALEAVLDALPTTDLIVSDISGVISHNLRSNFVLFHGGHLRTGHVI